MDGRDSCQHLHRYSSITFLSRKLSSEIREKEPGRPNVVSGRSLEREEESAISSPAEERIPTFGSRYTWCIQIVGELDDAVHSA